MPSDLSRWRAARAKLSHDIIDRTLLLYLTDSTKPQGASERMLDRILRCWREEGKPEADMLCDAFPRVLLPSVLLSNILPEKQLSDLDEAARRKRRTPDALTLNEQETELRLNIAATDLALRLMSKQVEPNTKTALDSVRKLHRTLQSLPLSPIFP